MVRILTKTIMVREFPSSLCSSRPVDDPLPVDRAHARKRETGADLFELSPHHWVDSFVSLSLPPLSPSLSLSIYIYICYIHMYTHVHTCTHMLTFPYSHMFNHRFQHTPQRPRAQPQGQGLSSCRSRGSSPTNSLIHTAAQKFGFGSDCYGLSLFGGCLQVLKNADHLL